MRKLNNKGFAISTMLYGILTLVIIILTLTLSIMRSSYNTEKAATEEILDYLNDCSLKEINLESCYFQNGNDSSVDCSAEYESYTTCMGRNNNSIGVVGQTIGIKTALTSNTDIKQIGERYVFQGSNPNNYIQLGKVKGRIIAMESTGIIKVLVSDETVSYSGVFTSGSVSVSNGVERWNSSDVKVTFQNAYNNFDYQSKMTEGYFYMRTIPTTDEGNVTTVLEGINSYKDRVTAKFGLPSLADYLYASGNSSCSLEDGSLSLDNALSNCSQTNWMNDSSSCRWLSTTYNLVTVNMPMSYKASNGVVKENGDSTTCKASMVIYLSSNIKVGVDGTGEEISPYVVDLG